MKITIEATSKVVQLEMPGGGGMPARIWEGTTERGTPVHCYVTRISPSITEPVPQAVVDEFLESLRETRKPTPGVEAIPLRLIL